MSCVLADAIDCTVVVEGTTPVTELQVTMDPLVVIPVDMEADTVLVDPAVESDVVQRLS